MADDLEARLQSHSQAFEGLLSLIPAKYYYEQDNSNSWQKKKQTPEERRMAKKAKLNPASHKSAKDIMDENERKRRRQDGDEDGDGVSDLEAPGREKPLQGLKPKKVQKQKTDQDVHSKKDCNAEANGEQPSQSNPSKKSKAERALEKEKRRKDKAARKEARDKTRKSKLQEKGPRADPTADTPAIESEEVVREQEDVAAMQEEDEAVVLGNDMEAVDVTGLVADVQQDAQSSASASPAPGSTFSHASPQPVSSNSSISPAVADDSSKTPDSGTTTGTTISSADIHSEPTTHTITAPKKIKLTEAERQEVQARLASKIEALRKARNADGLNGKPAKNRAELIEARRLKAEKRKQVKKDLRQDAKEAEKKAEMEAELARMRGSPLIGSDIFSGFSTPTSPSNNNFAFGRVTFNDGQRLNSNLSGLVDGGKKKGAMDTRTALLAAEKRKARLMSFDHEKRADIEQKDIWLNAKKKVHGERVRDDTNLLKKTLKRKEKTKLKSEKEWNERIEGTKKAQDFKAKKREANIAKRKEERGGKGKGKGTKKVVKKKLNRPGFEGSFRGRSK